MHTIALVGFSYLGGLLFATIFKNVFTPILFLALTFLLFFFERKKTFKLGTITAFSFTIAAAIYFFHYEFIISPIRNLDGKDINVVARITELPIKKESGGYTYTVKVDKIIGMDTPKNFKVSISSFEPIDAEIYDSFTAKIHVFVPSDNVEFPLEKFYRSKGIYLKGYFCDYNKYEVTKTYGIKPFYFYALKVRKFLISTIDYLFTSEQSGIISGIFLGNKNNISYDKKFEFSKIGISHIMAVSGMHLAMLSGILVGIFKKLRLKDKTTYILVSVNIFAFMAITGFSPSVLRAGIMFIVYFASLILGRKQDKIDALGTSVLFITLFKPDSACDIGFLLSVSSTLGILVLGRNIPKLINYKNYNDINPFAKSILGSIFTTFSATVFSFPILIFYFKKISIISIFSNILIIYPVSFMLILLVISIFLYILNIPSFILHITKSLCGFIADYIIICSSIISKIPYSSFYVDYHILILWLTVNLIFFVIYHLYFKNKNLFLSLSIFSVSTFFAINLAYELKKLQDTRISVVNCADGCCVLFFEKNGTNAILSLNEKTNEQKIKEAMYYGKTKKLKNIIVVDYKDHNIEFLNSLFYSYNPEKVFMDVEDYNFKYFYGYPISSFSEKSSFEISENFKILKDTIGDMSLLYSQINEEKILICPSEGNFDDIPYAFLDSDVFISGCMPSNYDKNTFLYSVFSVSESDFMKINSKVTDYNNLFITAKDGTISIYNTYKNKKLEIKRGI